MREIHRVKSSLTNEEGYQDRETLAKGLDVETGRRPEPKKDLTTTTKGTSPAGKTSPRFYTKEVISMWE